MKRLLQITMALPLLTLITLLSALPLHGQSDTIWAPIQTILLQDTTIVAAVTADDGTRLTVTTPSGKVHTLPKSAIVSMSPAALFPPLAIVNVRPTRSPAEDSLRGTAIIHREPKRHWTIRLASGETLSEAGLEDRRGDSLLVSRIDGRIVLPVEEIIRMQREEGHHFWRGAAIGAAGGALVLLAVPIKFVDGYSRALLGAIGGVIVGAVVGAIVPDITEIDFTSMSREQKAVEIDRLLIEEME